MNCPHCTTPIPEQSRFCLSCGVNVSGETGERTLEFDPGLQTRLQQDLGSEFVVERELGRGGMAVVYLAHDMRLGRKVAIKVLPPELTFGKPESVERFRREARTAATLDHPNVIPIYRVSGNGPLVWYVMKYLEGESLDQVLRRVFHFSVDATVRIIEQVAAALEHAHERGVVHRDVKPANMVIGPKGRVTVTDFGIAKAMDSPLLTASGAAMGTPFYMSPEQCAGDAITGASDQYALAVMTYQMLCGRVPFTGQSVVDVVKKHCLDKVPPLQELQPDLSAPVVGVVERALAKQPADRFPSVSSFAKALELTARGVDIGASYPTSSDLLYGAETLMIDPKRQRRVRRGALSARAAAPKSPRARWMAPAGAVLVVLAGAALAAREFWPASAVNAGTDSTSRQAPAVPASSAGDTLARDKGATTRRSDSAPSDATRRGGRQPVTPPAARPQGAAFLTLGSRPLAAMTINGRAVTPPVIRYRVAAGHVVVHFQVTDSTGSWPFDTTFTLTPGDTNLGRIQLRRPPARP